jgi:hypothetical protein
MRDLFSKPAVLAATAACLLAEPVPVAAAANAEDLLIVDCLLPGQIRRLGAQVTYATARQALRTSAGNCRIRGGEYVAADKASYASALQTWLPLAKEGNTEAQTNLGEIFEKGLGVPPQYDLAVQWYTLAAEQGFSRAQINLGALHERGLGVPKDMGKALEWYRRASGLGAANLGYVPAEVTQQIEQLRGERAALQQELSTTRLEREALQKELEDVRRQLRQNRSQLDSRQREVEAARRQLEQRAKQVETRARQPKTPENDAEIAKLQKQLHEQQRLVERRESEVQRLTRTVGDLEGSAQKLQTALATTQQQRAGEAAAAKAEVATARAEAVQAKTLLAKQSERLATAEAELAKQFDQVGKQSAEVARLRREVAAQQDQSAQGRAARQQMEAALKTREKELSDTRSRVGKLNEQVAALDKEAAELRQRAEATPVVRGQAAAEVLVAKAPDVKFGRFHALVIGNNEYRHMPKLESAVRDASAIEEILRNRYGFKTTLLLNADRYQLLSALNKLRETLTDEDNLLIYYAGHGELDRVNNRGHWLPVDAEPSSTANWISNVQITDILNAMSAKHVLLIADSCYSGTLTRSAVARLDAGMSAEARQKWVQVMTEKRARVVLSSGGLQPVLDSGSGGHSVFAGALLAVLRGNRDVLEAQRLAHVVAQRVATSAAGASIGQLPQYAPIQYCGHEAGDFFFVPAS